MDRFKGPFRIRVRCKTALSVPNENYQRFPVLPTFFPLPRNESSLSKSNNITFAPSRLSLDSSTTAHYVVQTHKRDNHVDIVSTTEAEDDCDCDEYDDFHGKTTTKGSVANTPFFRKFSGQDTELETWDETEENEEDFCSSASRTETKGTTATVVTTPITAITSISSATSHKDKEKGVNGKYEGGSGSGSRPRSKYSVSSFKTKSQTSSSKKSTDKNKSRPLNGFRNSVMSAVDWQSKHPFEGKSLEELEQLLRKYQQNQDQNQEEQSQSKSAKNQESDVESPPPPHLETFHHFIDTTEPEMGGDGDNNFSGAPRFQSKLFEKFPGKNVGKFSMCKKLQMNETGDFFSPPDSIKNQFKTWTSSLETEFAFNGHRQMGSSIPNPILDRRKLQFEGNSPGHGPGPFQRQLLDRLQARIPLPTKPMAGIGKPVLSDFPRPKFFQAPLRRLPTSWHFRPGTPLQKIYGSVVKHMPMDTETQRQKLIYQAVDNGHMYRRIKQATSIYNRKEQLMDFKRHEAFIKFRGPVANIEKRAAQKYNSSNSCSMSSIHQNGHDIDIEQVDSISISISDNEADAAAAHYEDDEFELDSNNNEDNDARVEVHVDSSDSNHPPQSMT